MAWPEEVAALRRGVALAQLDGWAALHLPGGGALAALDPFCPADLSLREGRMRQTLLLEDDGSPLADLYVCRVDDGALLLAEGPEPAALAERVRSWTGRAVEDLRGQARLLALTGPYAWELLGELVGREVYELPTHFSMRVGPLGRWLCLRAGKTGEHGYLLLVPEPDAAGCLAQILEKGAAFDLAWAGQEALELCALESWSFNIRREGRAAGVTPLELQLQWRIDPGRDFPGAAALRARRRAGCLRRLTAVAGPDEVCVGDGVTLDGRRIGTVVNAGWSPARGEWVAMALLDRAYAVPGIDRCALERRGASGPLRTLSPPFVVPRSLFVDPGSGHYPGAGAEPAAAPR